jgi:hypothetical protein
VSFADDADKLFNRVHVARRFAPLAHFGASIRGKGLCLVARPGAEAARPS